MRDPRHHTCPLPREEACPRPPGRRRPSRHPREGLQQGGALQRPTPLRVLPVAPVVGGPRPPRARPRCSHAQGRLRWWCLQAAARPDGPRHHRPRAWQTEPRWCRERAPLLLNRELRGQSLGAAAGGCRPGFGNRHPRRRRAAGPSRRPAMPWPRHRAWARAPVQLAKAACPRSHHRLPLPGRPPAAPRELPAAIPKAGRRRARRALPPGAAPERLRLRRAELSAPPRPRAPSESPPPW
mmetsp:Transcript_1547/g.3479  ORF Transcript_1547/g.3479 Transcript_1547/m.3479 type:complete len:239 (-) Transcript_1547:1537-2253(-)